MNSDQTVKSQSDIEMQEEEEEEEEEEEKEEEVEEEVEEEEEEEEEDEEEEEEDEDDDDEDEDDEDEDLALQLMLVLHGIIHSILMKPLMKSLSQMLVKLAEEKCQNEAVLKWLRDNSQSQDFSNLVEIFHFFNERIEEEEKKNHGDNVDIIFVAHGAIRDVMIPACCLLPLPSITDVVLYSPWNCSTSADLTYALATGRLRPSHRVFISKTNNCKTAAPDKLPNRWNSMKEVGEKMIPNIMVSPLRPDDGVWKRYESLQERHMSPGRNRIVIPYKFPEVTVGSVPFSVVSLALSLVLLSSRFTATVHLDTCLSDQSTDQKFDPEYLRNQYAYTPDNTLMTVPDDMFTESWIYRLRRRFN